MIKDNDIRAFMHKNRPALSDSGAFMAGFERQTGFLPQPAAFAVADKASSRADSEFTAELMAGFFKSLKARNRRIAIAAAVAVMAASAAAAVLMSFVPDSWFGFLELLPRACVSPLGARCLLTGFSIMPIVAVAAIKIYSHSTRLPLI